ncbi:CBO0543 family protein [Desertibacillus haloalkaliphilus]|uniref:CBO0543 family protein n=1 Tax=Desertibacillus haloalkaliphilus TaxID=1328930 RepID=UPI001C280F41|nr:CBO0543 family protein [Desertibacillus haloalkaliphilus]MBU8906193.1 hypothetical protein [Desertibacillus haloalkaliphilus]
MFRDKSVLIFVWCMTIVLLFKFVPKEKVRHGILAFLFKQLITWVFGLMVVEKGLIKYPVRLFFHKANKSSFSFEYFIYPTICAIFNVNYPEYGSRLKKSLYYLLLTGLLTLGEVVAERYTNLIHYVKWRWYWSFITMGVAFYFSRIFYRWFFKEEFQLERANIEQIHVGTPLQEQDSIY